MLTFFLYLMKSVLCLALFYPFYMVLLSRETFHRFNRMALISILLASAVIPACRITTEEPMLLSQLYQRWEHWLTGQEAETAVVDMEWADMDFAAMPMAEGDLQEVAQPFSLGEFLSNNWGDLLFLLYVAGILFLLGRHLVSVIRLFALLRKGRMVKLDDGNRLYLHTHADIAPFSWMKLIVISQADYEENGRQIVAHEQAHISNGHSWDLLLVELCLLFQWFNPAAWLLRQELQNIHEYEADDSVLRRGINAKEYQLLIIKKAVGARLYSLANNLNHSSLKKRLTMMMKEKSHPWARLKYLYVLPLAAISMVAFAHTEAANNSNGISEAKVTEVSANEQTSGEKSSDNDVKKVKMRCRLVNADTGQPVHGANVVVRGTRHGTVSDKEGRFEIEVNPAKDVVNVSYVGLGSVSIKMVDGYKPNVEHTIKMHPVGVTLDMLEGKAQTVSDTPRTEEPEGDNDDEVFMVVENMPEFPGGMAELMKFLQQNIKYPAEAHQKGEQGRVIVQFVVGKDGKLRDFEVKKSVSPTLDAEAIRLCKAMPDWKPGRQRNMAVDCKFTLPISFRLQGPDGNPDEGTYDLRVFAEGKAKTVSDTPGTEEPKGDNDDEVFMVVEKMPEFPGGTAGLMKFLQQNIKYPVQAMKDSIQGRVIVQFVIKRTGEVANPTIVRSVSPELDAEAIRVINAMPLWAPGEQMGKAVSVKYTFPIQFKLYTPKD